MAFKIGDPIISVNHDEGGNGIVGRVVKVESTGWMEIENEDGVNFEVWAAHCELRRKKNNDC